MRRMRSVNQPPMRQGSPNDFQTPENALLPLLPFLKREWVIWECACGKGNLVRGLERKGFKVVGSDVEKDFLKSVVDCDCIITNPPFSLKQEFLARCYELGKPFALLLPLTTLETAKRQELFKRFGVEIIFFDRRINFETPDGSGGGSWFATAWFTHGLNVGKDLNFYKSGVESFGGGV